MEYSKFIELLGQNGFNEDDAKQGGISFLGSQRDLKAGVTFIAEDEMPLAVIGGEYFYTGPGTAGTNNAVLILTNERLIKADKKIKNVDMTQFYIDDINSSDFNTSFLSSQMSISTTSGNISLTKIKKDTGRRFCDVLTELIRDHKKSVKNPKVHVAASSGMDEVKKAKELLDEGIITEKEFDAIKKKHIG